MKLKLVFIMFATGFVFMTSAQQQPLKSKIGLIYSLNGTNSIWTGSSTVGASNRAITNANGIGLIYLHPVTNWLEWETGLIYTLFDTQYKPVSDAEAKASTFALIDIPLGLRASFANYFFINGGLLLDLDPLLMGKSGIASQTGIGASLGLGIKYDFKFGGSIFFNPYGKFHSLLPFGTWKNHERIIESGWKIGVTYRL